MNNKYELDEELSTDKQRFIEIYIKMVNRGTYVKRDVLTYAKLIFGYKDKILINHDLMKHE